MALFHASTPHPTVTVYLGVESTPLLPCSFLPNMCVVVGNDALDRVDILFGLGLRLGPVTLVSSNTMLSLLQDRNTLVTKLANFLMHTNSQPSRISPAVIYMYSSTAPRSAELGRYRLRYTT